MIGLEMWMMICYICLRWRGEDCESVMLVGLMVGGGATGERVC